MQFSFRSASRAQTAIVHNVQIGARKGGGVSRSRLAFTRRSYGHLISLGLSVNTLQTGGFLCNNSSLRVGVREQRRAYVE